MDIKKITVRTILCLLVVWSFAVNASYAGPNSAAGCALDMDHRTRAYDSQITSKNIESSKSVNAGDEIWIAVVVQNAVNLVSYQVDVSYDPVSLEYTNGLEENPMGGVNNFLKTGKRPEI